MNKDLKCMKLPPESVQTIIAALLLAASGEDHTAGKYEERAREAACSGDMRRAGLLQEAAANCRQRAEEYRDVYGQLVKQK